MTGCLTAAGVLLTVLLDGVWLPFAAFLAALLTANLGAARGLMIAVAGVGAAAALAPWPAPGADAAFSAGLLLLAAPLLMWNPGHGQLRLEQLRDAFEHAPIGVAVVDANGDIAQANDTFLEITCGTAEPTPEQRDRLARSDFFLEVVDRCSRLAGNAVSLAGYECELQLDDGSCRFLSISGRLLQDASGRVPFKVIQVLDLTDQRHVRRALNVSETRFQSIIENSRELTMIVDAAGRVTYANPIAGEVLAAAEGRLIGSRLADFVTANDRNAFMTHLDESRRRPGALVSQEKVRLDRSDPVYVEFRFSTLADSPGVDGTVVIGRVITERVTADRRLRDSEDRFSTIFHASPDAMVILRQEDATILDFNGSFTRLLGYAREDAIGEKEPAIRIFDDPRERRRIVTKLMEDHECIDEETLVRTRDGRILNVEISLRFVEIEGEICVLCVGRDITKRRLAEDAQLESQAKFSRIFSDSPDGIVIIRLRDSLVVDINDAFIDASGFDRSEIVGHPVHELPIWADPNQLARVTQMLFEDGAYQNYTITFLDKSGTEIPALISANILDLDDEPHALCMAKDMRELRRTEEQLRQSELRFRGAFESAPIGMVLATHDGRIFQANNFAAELLEYAPDALPGTHISHLVPTEDRASLREDLAGLTYGDETMLRCERRMLCRSGTEIWTNFHAVLQRTETGEPSYFIVQIADITEMKLSQDRMERLAFYDPLTDLANRRLFSNRLEHAIARSLRTGKSAALIYLDLDNFKRINDTLGHEAGDELLREVAHRLTRCVRQEDTVARFGGDEFTILLYDMQNSGDAGRVAEKIIEQLQAPITVTGMPFVVTPSIGITIFPDDSVEPNVLTKNADLAMYRAKELGRNNYQFFSEDMNSDAIGRMNTERELRAALANGEFELLYQPKVRLADQRVVGVESLLRWNHPDRGCLAPDGFIELAEENGFIVDLGTWVLEQACRDGRALASRSGQPMVVAVNVSPRQFRDAGLVATVRRCLAEAGLPPSCLELEITETMIMDDADISQTTLERLRGLGVRIAIDDFGTGYSSLNYLKKFPIDTVKVDQTFVGELPNNPDGAAITAAVIAMAHRLQMEVVAEGVETPEQLNFLARHRCEYGQGFYFSKPRPLTEIEGILAPNVSMLRSS